MDDHIAAISADDDPWEIMQLSLQGLTEQHYLTQNQATRIQDQITETIDYVYKCKYDVRHEFDDQFVIRVNGKEIAVVSDDGYIYVTTPEDRAWTRDHVMNENKLVIRESDDGMFDDPDLGLPPYPDLKPAYYKLTDPDILMDEFEGLAREIEQNENYPKWVNYAIRLHEYVRNNIETKPKKPSTQNTQSPKNTLGFRAGDIGSKATLLASLYESAGITSKIIISHESKDGDWRPILFIKNPRV